MAIRRQPGETRNICLQNLTDQAGAAITSSATVTFEVLDTTGAVVIGPLTATSGGTDDWCVSITAPSTVGTYTLQATIVAGAVTEVIAESLIVSSAVSGGTTRGDLRRRIASELGDLFILTATKAGSETTLFDEINARRPLDHFKNRDALFTEGTGSNLGLVRRVTSSDSTTQVINFQPALPAVTATGDVVELYNERGVGWTVDEYHRVINAAIRLGYEDHLTPISADVAPVANTVTDSFWGTMTASYTITPPSTMTKIHSVLTTDSWGRQFKLPRAVRPGAEGYWVDRNSGTVILAGSWWAYGTTPATIRLEGYAEPDILSDDEDRTTIDEEWIVTWCMARLLLAGAHRNADPDRERRGYFLSQESNNLRRRVRTLYAPNTENIRT